MTRVTRRPAFGRTSCFLMMSYFLSCFFNCPALSCFFNSLVNIAIKTPFLAKKARNFCGLRPQYTILPQIIENPGNFFGLRPLPDNLKQCRQTRHKINGDKRGQTPILLCTTFWTFVPLFGP